MTTTLRLSDSLKFLCTAAVAVIALTVYSDVALSDEIKIILSGANEVPAVNSSASGSGTLVINADMSVSGTVTTTGVTGTAAHIHQGAVGANGPVIVPLTKNGDNSWTVPANAKLSDAQYAAYKAGGLYINVHSAENKGGEIRGQLK